MAMTTYRDQALRRRGLAPQVLRLMRRSADFSTMENHLHVRAAQLMQTEHQQCVSPTCYDMRRGC